MKKSLLAAAFGLTCTLAAAPAAAADHELDFWLNPSVAKDLGDGNFFEIETQQRFFANGPDLYVGRLWFGREVADGVEVMVGIHRGREGDGRETRLLQQVSYPLVGRLEGRTRLEQRFFNDEPRTAWRLRQRVELGLPLSEAEDGWTFVTNAEGFFTLRAGSADGQTGLTGLRTFVGVERGFGRFDLGLGYTRQQNIRRGGPDRIGHAPTIELTINL